MATDKRRIEEKASTTAGFMCIARAASYKEKRECYKGPDNVAYELTPSFLKFIVRSRLLFKSLNRRFFAKGAYEYVIARTKYFDAAFKNALEEGFDQIVIFGAGYDSRALRFGGFNKSTTVFEVDAPKTQEDKIKGFKSRKLSLPSYVVFVPVDFDKESLEAKMLQAGFKVGKRTLFSMEGVTMYLTKDAVENTFRFMSDSSGVRSMVVFDHIYAGVLRGENKYYGEKGMAQSVAKAGEKWRFGLEEGETAGFLDKFGFTIKDNCNAKQLEERYFKNSRGEIVAKINGTHAIVSAVKE